MNFDAVFQKLGLDVFDRFRQGFLEFLKIL
ncbi:MAG: hypothetical protein H6Q31_3102, partial [Bacteroidetes bacterium]|nr:hypothetical protein [Bacteroidota bacterium]